MSYGWAPAWPAIAGSIIPHVADVGVAVYLPTPGINVQPRYVGTDGSLWILGTSGFQQIASPGDLSRIAVAPDGTLWCASQNGTLWKMNNSVWTRVPVFDRKVDDVDVAADGTVYLITGHNYWSILPGGTRPLLRNGSRGSDVVTLQERLNVWVTANPGAGIALLEVDGKFGPKTEAAVRTFQTAKGLQVDGLVGPKTWEALAIPPTFHGVFAQIDAIAGLGRPDDDVNPYGQAWGVVPTFGDGAVGRCGTVNGWSPTNFRDAHTLSASQGNLWMIRTDGTAWTSTDGATQIRAGDAAGFTRVAASYQIAYGVKSDGSSWVWRQIDVVSPPPPPPPPPPPQDPPSAQTPRPVISVATRGSGESTVFVVSGSGFLRSVTVTLRAARIGEDQIHNFYWITTSKPDGQIQADLPIPCLTGLTISFSANDGRPDPTDITNRFWSNTANASCP